MAVPKHMLTEFGIHYRLESCALLDTQLRSVFGQGKFFPNDLNSLPQLGFGPNFWKILRPWISKKIRAAYSKYLVAHSARVSLASIDQSLISCRNQFSEIFPCHLVSSTSSILYTAWHQSPVSKKQWNLSLAKRCNCCNKLFEREEFFCCVNHLCCVIIKHKEAATASAAALEQAAKKYVLHEWIRVSEAYLQDISQVILQLFEFVKHAKNYGAHTTLHV